MAKSGWRKKNKESKFKNMKPTVKHSGERMLVYESIATFETGEIVFIDSIRDKNIYLNVLKK